MVKECIICRREFEGGPWNKICCSLKCRHTYKSNYESNPKRILYKKKYNQSIKIKDYEKMRQHTQHYKEYQHSYDMSENRRKSKKKYAQTEKYKIKQLKACLKRRAIKNNIIEMFSWKKWLQMKEATKGICPECKEESGLDNITLDHIYAISLASKDYLKTGIKRIYTIKDIQPLCRRCNSSKQDKLDWKKA